MPSVGSTPTAALPVVQKRTQQITKQTVSPVVGTAAMTVKAPVAKRRLKLAQKYQPVLPLQLQYQQYQPQQVQSVPQMQQIQTLPLPPPSQALPSLPRTPSQPLVTTTQPQPAGVFNTHNNNVNHSYNNNNNNTSKSNSSSSGSGSNSNNNNNDMSPVSSCNSISSTDTNHTILNAIIKQRNERKRCQPQSKPNPAPSQSVKYSQFMIITPAVSIDRDFENESHLDFEDFANAAQNNGNLFRSGLRRSDSSSDDSGNSSDNSFRSNYNPYLHHSRQHLLSKKSSSGGGAHQFYSFSSWRWCTLLCAAMRCFGSGYGNQAPYSSSFVPHHRLRRSSSYNGDTAYDYEHFAAPFKARKTRDHMNNITYEL